MLHPSYTEITDKICETEEERLSYENSKFSMIIGVARRARQITDKRREIEKKELGENEKKSSKIVTSSGVVNKSGTSEKPLSKAIDELYTGKLHILPLDKKIEFDENGKELVIEDGGAERV